MNLIFEVNDGVAGFGGRVKYALIIRKMTQAELSRQTGICKEFIIKIINGLSYPTITKAAKIADALDVSLDWLAGRDEPGKQTV